MGCQLYLDDKQSEMRAIIATSFFTEGLRIRVSKSTVAVSVPEVPPNILDPSRLTSNA